MKLQMKKIAWKNSWEFRSFEVSSLVNQMVGMKWLTRSIFLDRNDHLVSSYTLQEARMENRPGTQLYHKSNHPHRRYLLGPVYSNDTAKYFQGQAEKDKLFLRDLLIITNFYAYARNRILLSIFVIFGQSFYSSCRRLSTPMIRSHYFLLTFVTEIAL